MKKSLALSIAAIFLWSAHSLASELLSGPMVGHTTTDSAKIWIETEQPSQVRILYWQEPRTQYNRSLGQPMKKGEATAMTNATPPHVGVVQLEGLNPGWLIYYEVELDGKMIRPQTSQVFSLMPPSVTRDDEEQLPNFSVAFAR